LQTSKNFNNIKPAVSLYLGEIIICWTQVKTDARQLSVSVEYELAWVVVHGILHLLGYHHENNVLEAHKMRTQENFIFPN